MSKSMGDRNLLLGILAWQKQFISRDALIAAMNAWALAKGKGLAQILREQKALTENQHALLEETVRDHLSRHGHDAGKSLAALSSVDVVKQDLAQIADPDVQASLAQVSTAIPEVALEPLAGEPILAEVVIEKPRDERPKTSVKKSPALDSRPAAAVLRGGIPLWALVAGGAIAGGLVVVIVLMSIVLAVVLTRDTAPIAQVKPGDDPLKPGKEVDKGGDKPPVKDPVILKKENPPIDPEPPTVDRKPTDVIGAAEWRVEAGELVVDNPTLKRAYLYFGSTQWTDYDFAFETNSAARLSGTLALFRLKDAANHYGLSLGTFQRKKHSLNRVEKGLLTYHEPHFEEPFIFNQWYAVRIEARGDQIRCFVDGKQVFDTKNSAHAQGQVALGATPEAKARWKNIKVTAPDGKLLWDGLPDLSGTKPTPPAAFVSLFNGKDLTGWKPHQTYGGNWRVENGILIGSAPAVGYLATARDDFKDFHLRVEARFNDAGVGADGSVLFRSTLDLLGYETIINHPIKTTGSTYVRARSMLRDTGASSVPLPPGQWFTLELVAVGDRISIMVNGKTVSTIVDKNKEFSSGRITLHHRAKAVLEFRKIEIKELPTEAAPPVVLAKDFAPLFNGKDLTGWKTHPKQPGDWQVVDGILTGRGPAVNSLYTVGGDYKNFHLRAETRINDGGVGAVFSRAPFGPLTPSIDPKMPLGFRAIINSTHPTAFKTGGFFVVSQDKATGGGVAQLLPPNEWITLEILAENNRLLLLVNGKQTGNINDFKAQYPTGHIALNLHDPASVLEFRKVEIKALQPSDMPPDIQRVFVAGELTPLFNGKDLTGWKTHPKQPGDWRVVDGVLVGRGPEVSSLYTERGDFKDFQLSVEARINGAGLGAVFARAPFGPIPFGFQARINNANRFPNRTGSLTLREATGGITSGYQSQIPPGEWFTLDVHVQNDRAAVRLNGKSLTSVIDQKKSFPNGHIGLFLENPETIIEFRKIEIRELYAPNAALNKPLAKVEIPGDAQPPQMKRFPLSVPAGNMGAWRIEGNELVHDMVKSPMSIFFGDPKWTDYDFSVDAMKVAGNDQFGLWFRRADADRSFIFGLAARQGGMHMAALMERGDIKHQQPLLNAKEPLQERRWYNAKISVRGEKAECYLDGVKLFEFKSDQLPTGGVGLRTWFTAYRFKNIKVTAPDGTTLLEGLPDWVLTPNAVVPPVPIIANGEFVPLFNGKDLTGWKKHAQQPGDWRVVDGILTGFSAGNGHLFTDRGDYKDFHLRLEARTKDGKAGGVRFRYTQDLQGYETTLNSRSGGVIHIRKGGEPIRNLGQLVPVPADEWTTLDLLVRGNRLQLKVNGKTTVDALDARNAFTSGHICLYDFKESIEFRKIEIKEFIPVAAPPLPPLVRAEEFVPLFNGKDLTGWQVEGNELWRIDRLNGHLTGNGPNTAILTKRSDFKEFTLRIELSCASNTEAIFGFRQTPGPQGKWLGLTSRLDGDIATVRAGLAGVDSAKAESGNAHQAKAGEKFTLEIRVKNDSLQIYANGKGTGGIKYAPGRYPPGAIGLFVAKGGVRISKFEIKEETPAPAPIVAAEGFVPLFNGKDLTGWKTNRIPPGDWRVFNGILTGSSPNVRELYTVRDDYGDFHLRLEGRINDDGNNFVVFRYPHGEPNMAKLHVGGYAVRVSSSPKDFSKTGSLMVYETVGVRSLAVREPLVAAGQWFTMDIIAVGNQIDIKVNGQLTKSYLNPKTHLMGGRIVLGFGDTNRQTTVEYRRIEIKEFKAVAAPPQPPPERPLGEFVTVLNGKDLTGWRVEGNDGWKASPDGELVGQGPDSALISKRSDYRNFIAKIELSASADAEAFFAFRETPGPGGKVIGLTSRLTGDGAIVRAGYAGTNGFKFESGNQQIQVKPGEVFLLEFHVRQDGFRILANGKVTGSSGYAPDRHPPGAIGLHIAKGTVRIKKFEISAETPAPVAPPFVPVGDFVPLFNGKDLAGWQPHLKTAGNWSVAKSVLTGEGEDAGILHTVRADFKDYHLRMEARFTAPPDAGSSGVLFRSLLGRSGYEIVFADGKTTGGLQLNGKDFGKSIPAKFPANVMAGDWLTLDFIAQGKRLTVQVNGKETTDFVDEEDLFKDGHIALRQGADCKAEFRKIEIRELKPAALAPPREPPLAKGVFVPLFNAKDLAGWQPHSKRPGNWRVENGILIGSAPIGGSLYSTRGDYQDFHLRAEVRINDKGFGRVFGRAAYDPNKIPFKVLGYEALINQRPLGDKTGTLTATSLTNSIVTQAKESPAPAGEWFLLEILAKGDLVTVRVNGIAVAEFRDDRRQYARSGHIALHQDANAIIEFRKVEIEDLSAP